MICEFVEEHSYTIETCWIKILIIAGHLWDHVKRYRLAITIPRTEISPNYSKLQ